MSFMPSSSPAWAEPDRPGFRLAVAGTSGRIWGYVRCEGDQMRVESATDLVAAREALRAALAFLDAESAAGRMGNGKQMMREEALKH